MVVGVIERRKINHIEAPKKKECSFPRQRLENENKTILIYLEPRDFLYAWIIIEVWLDVITRGCCFMSDF